MIEQHVVSLSTEMEGFFELFLRNCSREFLPSKCRNKALFTKLAISVHILSLKVLDALLDVLFDQLLDFFNSLTLLEPVFFDLLKVLLKSGDLNL